MKNILIIYKEPFVNFFVTLKALHGTTDAKKRIFKSVANFEWSLIMTAHLNILTGRNMQLIKIPRHNSTQHISRDPSQTEATDHLSGWCPAQGRIGAHVKGVEMGQGQSIQPHILLLHLMTYSQITGIYVLSCPILWSFAFGTAAAPVSSVLISFTAFPWNECTTMSLGRSQYHYAILCWCEIKVWETGVRRARCKEPCQNSNLHGFLSWIDVVPSPRNGSLVWLPE